MAIFLVKNFADLIATSFQNLSVALVRQNGTECSGGGYERQKYGNVQVSEDSNYVYISNSNSIIFPFVDKDLAPSNNPIAKISLYNDANLIATIDLNRSKPYLAQDKIIIPPDGLKIKIPKVNTWFMMSIIDLWVL